MNRSPRKTPAVHAKSNNPGFRQLHAALGKAKKILLSTHMLPDGDGLGAEVALYHYLKRAKKDCCILNPDDFPKRYQFLDPEGSIFSDPSKPVIWDKFDLWVILDTNDPRRLGKLWSEIAPRAGQIIFLDHHSDLLIQKEWQKKSFPKNASVISDPLSSSIGELLYQVFSQLKLSKINLDVATGLYVSVMTDTNSFRYARTTPLAHRIAASMIDLGVNPEEIYQAIYSSKEVSHIQLLGHMLQDVRTSCNGKIAWVEVDLRLRQKFRATADDTLSFLNLLLLLKEAEVVCLFREEDHGPIRVSIKSKGRLIVNKLALELGGGGHDYAAGLALPLTLRETVKKVVDGLEKLVKV